MNCKICHAENKEIFVAKILKKYDVHYFACSKCGFICTEDPYWLEEAYISPINTADTGILARNIFFSNLMINIIYYLFNYKGKFLDYAGGYGIFTRLMRDYGFDFKWQDKFAKNFLARGFEYSENDSDLDMVTAFEVLEHLIDPIKEFEEIFKISSNVLFSTELIPDNTPNPSDWWYYGLNHGQHVSFYSKKTLEFIANKYGLNYYSHGDSLHLFTVKKINPIVFKILINNKSGLLFRLWAKKNLKSKTWDDYLLMDKK